MKISDGWKKSSIADIIFSVDGDTEKGLTKNRVIINRRKWGKNDLWYTGGPFMYFRTESGFSALGYIFMAVAAFSASAFDKCRDAVWVGLAILAGIVICSLAYLSAGSITQKHSQRWIPLCTVIRDGKIINVRADSLVLGDIILLKSGDRVCADAKLLSSEGLTVIDPPFTKRKGPIMKAAPGAMLTSDGGSAPEDFVLAGSEVISGHGKAIVCAIGTETEQGKRSRIRLVSAKDPEALLSLRRRGVSTGAVALIISFAAVAIGVFSPAAASDFVGLFLVFLSFAVSAGGEIIPAICCASYRTVIDDCSDRGLILRDASGVDYISNCDCIAVENSSFMKANKTELRALWTSGKTVDPKDSAGDDLLSMMLTGTDYGKGKYGHEIVLATSEHLSGRIDPAKYTVTTQNNKPIIEHRIIGATHYALFQSGFEQFFSVTGSIEDVISKCTKVRIGGKDLPLDKNYIGDILVTASNLLKGATSIIAVAVRVSPYNSMKRLSVLTSDLTFVGFIAMETPAHDGLPTDLAYLRDCGIPFVFFTDGSGEDISFARKLGIIKGREDLAPAADSDSAVADLLHEGSYGGAVYAKDENEVSAWLGSAKKTGKKVVYIGSKDHVRDAGYAVVSGEPAIGAGAYLTNDSNANVTTVLGSVRVSNNASSRLRKVYVYLFVSTILRLIYSLCILFGMPYVFPSVILAWGLVLDAIVSGLIFHLVKK